MKLDQQCQDRYADKGPFDDRNRHPQLNVELHQRLMLEGGLKPSTLVSAMLALQRIRRLREDEAQESGQ
ncbi:hypothetical protein [Roseateles oligotrophus]|uniref:Uncharacterized protein n=1 Tax=Roseateles oligotrophus TaxID=1769250 RepID=A0ABT2YLQ3_9BURK|nr:hypothetical protein [Roseateles oligotrophus]MCV2371006.1 hypothetical protein [Roseateles oligotrophus]